ncbi:MAG: OmpH family outer membrane protein [Sphingobacteriales bacterium]|nr:MAG: OmpH family outer membrane protein [Sphingobacteriales bacterium]
MKNAAVILSALALLGVLILFGLHFSGRKDSTTSKTKTVATPGKESATRIAFVDIDSFENNYNYLKAKREEFNKRQLAMQSELERSAQQFQNNAEAFQQKMQSGNISQAEGEATQRKLMQMQQTLRMREQTLTEQLLKEKDEFNQSLHSDLDSFLTEYNKDRRFDYILSHSKAGGSPILFAEPSLNITDDVIKGMNARKKTPAATTEKKK